jgi:hypothetical protein
MLVLMLMLVLEARRVKERSITSRSTSTITKIKRDHLRPQRWRVEGAGPSSDSRAAFAE